MRREFEDALRRALATAKYDAIHLDMINLAHYAKFLAGYPVLLSVNDAVSLGYLNSAKSSPSVAEKMKLLTASCVVRNYERRAYQNMVVHVVSGVDQAYLAEVCPSARVEVVELAVDPRYLTHNRRRDGEGRTVVLPLNFSAKGIHESVLEFLAKVAPSLERNFLGCSIQLLGRGANSSFVRTVSRYPNVQYLGWVEDYKSALARAHLAVFLETSGSGTKNRLLQAMALGLPVLLTPPLASGARSEHREHCWVCTNASEFKTAVELILSNGTLAACLGEKAQRTVRESHSLARVTEKWEELYNSLSRQRAPGRLFPNLERSVPAVVQ